MSSPHYSQRATSGTGETGGKSVTRSSENLELRTSNRRPSHQSRFSSQSRPSCLSQASATHMLVPPDHFGRLRA